MVLLREITLVSELEGPVRDDDSEFPLPEALLTCYEDVVFWQDVRDYITYVVDEAPELDEVLPC